MATLTAGRLAPAQLRRVATEAGIGPEDPLGPVIGALAETAEAVADLPEECARKFDAVDARLSAIMAKAETIAGGHVAHAAASALPRAIDRLVLVRYWWLAVVVGTLMAGGIYSAYLWGDRTRAEQVVQIRAGLELALTGRDAQQWLGLIRLNQMEGALRNCTPQPQTGGGEACSFTLWTKLPPAR